MLLSHIRPVCSVVAPCPRGASPVSVRRQIFTTGCQRLNSRAHVHCSFCAVDVVFCGDGGAQHSGHPISKSFLFFRFLRRFAISA